MHTLAAPREVYYVLESARTGYQALRATIIRVKRGGVPPEWKPTSNACLLSKGGALGKQSTGLALAAAGIIESPSPI